MKWNVAGKEQVIVLTVRRACVYRMFRQFLLRLWCVCLFGGAVVV